MAQPEMRAAMAKDFMTHLRSGRVPRGEAIVVGADPALLRSIADASRLAWLPAAPMARLADEARTLLEPKQWRALHRTSADELAERPLFRAIIQGARTVFGATPRGFCKIFPRLLAQAHRNYGPIVARTTEDGASMICFEDCAPEGLSLGLLDVFAGTVEGLVAPIAPTVRADVAYVPGARRATITVRW